jgi:hypothetical protein
MVEFLFILKNFHLLILSSEMDAAEIRHIYDCKLRNEKKIYSKCEMNIHRRHLNCCLIGK